MLTHLECTRCGEHYPADRAQSVCPQDAGILYARYDLPAIKAAFSSARLAGRADALGELLGEEHDLAVLAERVRSDAHGQRARSTLGRGSRRALLKAIARRRRRLRKRALRDGGRLYARRPKRFVRRVIAAVEISRR